MKNYDTAAAVACLGEAFLDILKDGPKALSCLEREALRLGHMTIASAVALALEAHDLELCADLPEGARIRERRTRTLATTFGDLTFSRRVCASSGVAVAASFGAPKFLSPTISFNSSGISTAAFFALPCGVICALCTNGRNRKNASATAITAKTVVSIIVSFFVSNPRFV